MQPESNDWPRMTAESRPWTRWWWLGAAVDRPTITRLLETYRRAGLGGVEITSIYGVKGQESRNIDYLSAAWVGMARHAVKEARRLGMKVDFPPGSGWRIGGRFITEATSAARLRLVKAGRGSGYRAECRPCVEPVKRAGPGGEGRAFNPFSRASLQAAIDHFRRPFKGLGFRAQFHDSWEYGSDCCPDFFVRFREKRGYDLAGRLAALAGAGDAEVAARVRYDVQVTLAELALGEFIIPWVAWCHELGQLSRLQAHGAPGNLLDFYAAADIPETEVFRRVTADTPLISKLASSAAHVAGRRRVSSETGTWLDEHFHVSLAALKLLVDNLFASGVNHHVFHGTAYSPPGAAWPGWLFYASTQLNPQNTLWRDLPALNAYIGRCQSVLQAGRSDNRLLVYLPVHDVLHDPRRRIAEGFTIIGDWLTGLAAANTFRRLWRRGYGFDYVSDRQIEGLRLAGRRLRAPGGAYQALIVPPCRFMPLKTLDVLCDLSARGGPVVFLAPAPADIPGLSVGRAHRARFAEQMARVPRAGDIEAVLSALGARRETLADLPGVLFVRRRQGAGHMYFVANQGPQPVDAWVRLAVAFEAVRIMDPMTGKTGAAQTRGRHDREVRIQLEPGRALFLWAFSGPGRRAGAWTYLAPDAARHTLAGTWRVEFLEGGPVLPPGYTTDALASWTERGGDAERFAGTARYRLEFDAPARREVWALDLGEVHASARVRLNGGAAVTLIGPFFRTLLRGVRMTGNELEIEVTNLAANRIRDLDRRGIEWKIFDDINIVNREYQPLDARDWPTLPAGLLGPVSLIAAG